MRDTAKPTPENSPQQEKQRSTIRKKTVAAIVAIGLAGGGGWAGWELLGHQHTGQVRLEPTSSAGPSPFMSPVGQDRANVTPPKGSGGQFSGDTAGLFADGGDKPSCDASRLLTALQGDHTKAQAWSAVLGLRAEDIAGFVGGLTPVLLRSDTSVTDHGYEGGTFTASPAILQAGTAVFIDNHGAPVVKCFSGNPLTKPAQDANADFIGTSWPLFRPGSVTIVERTQDSIRDHTFVNVDTGVSVTQPGKPDPGQGPAPTPVDPRIAALKNTDAEARKAADAATKAATAARANVDALKDGLTQAAAAAKPYQDLLAAASQTHNDLENRYADLERVEIAARAVWQADPNNADKYQAWLALRTKEGDSEGPRHKAEQDYFAALDKVKPYQVDLDYKTNQYKKLDAQAKTAEDNATALEAKAKAAHDAYTQATGSKGTDAATGHTANGNKDGQALHHNTIAQDNTAAQDQKQQAITGSGKTDQSTNPGGQNSGASAGGKTAGTAGENPGTTAGTAGKDTGTTAGPAGKDTGTTPGTGGQGTGTTAGSGGK